MLGAFRIALAAAGGLASLALSIVAVLLWPATVGASAGLAAAAAVGGVLMWCALRDGDAGAR
jgi:hypothetical protein